VNFVGNVEKAVGDEQNNQADQEAQDNIGPNDKNRQNEHDDAVDNEDALQIAQFAATHL